MRNAVHHAQSQKVCLRIGLTAANVEHGRNVDKFEI
jgi:hypothetical protein